MLEFLACPRCDQPIVSATNQLRCDGCKTIFPSLNGAPFLFADPAVTMDEWRARFHARVRQLEQEIKNLELALTDEDISDLTRKRLEKTKTGCLAHIDELNDLLKPLALSSLSANHESYLALRTRLPSDQGITTYYANLHRDWCWGDEENTQSEQLVREGLSDHNPKNILVLGSGGSRLAYDLHQSFPSALTVSLDFNPLLILVAARLARGETLTLHEFPIAPKTLKEIHCVRELEAPKPANDKLQFVVANALRAPFQARSFDTLITPWLVDILPEPLPLQAQRYNQLLSVGGRWVWFGSHAFRGANPRDQVSLEETIEIISSHGFSEPEVIEAEIPYMASPADRHARQEQVVVISMRKIADIPPPPRHVALPDWLVKSDLPVPTNESFKMQSMSTRIHAFIMAMINGERSINDMAQLMEEQQLMPKQEAEGAIRNFLIRMYEDSERYSTF